MLTSLKNPLIKKIRKLHYRKHRKRQNCFLLEGTNVVEAACEFKFPLETVCYTPQWQQNHPDLSNQCESLAQRVELVSEELLSAIATTVNPDGIIAVAPSNWQRSRSLDNLQLGLILEQLQDPGNMGTIIRTAVATGVEGIWASDHSVEWDHPKVLRASAGAWFRVPMAVETDLPSRVQQFSGQVVATVPTATKTYWEVDFRQPSLILLGNEGAGLSTQLAHLADERVKIPLEDGVESLNVAIAASLILYEAKRQRLGFSIS